MKARPGISCIFPAYNDGGTIASMVLGAERVLRELGLDHEIIVVNDGSTDHTAEQLAELQRLLAALRVVSHPCNLGYGAALRSGFASATRELIFYTDGDAQYDVRELPALLALLGPGVDLVNGYKRARQDPIGRVVVGWLYQHAVRLAFGLKLRDVDCDFRLFRRHVLDRVTLTCTSGAFCVELMAKLQAAGCTMVETPVRHLPRVYGRSQFFRPWRVARSLADLVGLWWELRGRGATPASGEERRLVEADPRGLARKG